MHGSAYVICREREGSSDGCVEHRRWSTLRGAQRPEDVVVGDPPVCVLVVDPDLRVLAALQALLAVVRRAAAEV